MRFDFRLESILRLREHEEELSREELVRIRNAIAQLEERLKELEIQKRSTEREMMKKMKSGMSGREIRNWMENVRALEMERRRVRSEIEKLREEEKRALERFLQKQRDRKALEKLKERQFKEHLRDLDRGERNALDEVAERRHHWRSEI